MANFIANKKAPHCAELSAQTKMQPLRPPQSALSSYGQVSWLRVFLALSFPRRVVYKRLYPPLTADPHYSSGGCLGFSPTFPLVPSQAYACAWRAAVRQPRNFIYAHYTGKAMQCQSKRAMFALDISAFGRFFTCKKNVRKLS